MIFFLLLNMYMNSSFSMLGLRFLSVVSPLMNERPTREYSARLLIPPPICVKTGLTLPLSALHSVISWKGCKSMLPIRIYRFGRPKLTRLFSLHHIEILFQFTIYFVKFYFIFRQEFPDGRRKRSFCRMRGMKTYASPPVSDLFYGESPKRTKTTAANSRSCFQASLLFLLTLPLASIFAL